jgi:hypothetical protein
LKKEDAMRVHIARVAGAAATVVAIVGLASAGGAGAATVPVSAARPARVPTVYVVGRGGLPGQASPGTVTPIDTATGKPGTTIKGLTGPIAITPDGTTVYALSSDHTVTPVSTATNKPGTAITVGSYPVAIAITR